MANEKFKQALTEALMPEYEINVPVSEEHTFSPKFEKRMKKLIKRRNKPYYKMINTFGKRTACAAAVMLILSSVTIMNVDALRNAFSDFFIRTYEKFSNVQPVEDSTAPENLKNIYEITYNLDDFKVIYENKDIFSYNITYLKDDIVIDFNQYIKNYNFNVNTEDAEEITNIDINRHDAICFFDNHNYYNLIWDNGDYIISLSSNIGKDALIDIAKSVQKVE